MADNFKFDRNLFKIGDLNQTPAEYKNSNALFGDSPKNFEFLKYQKNGF